MEQKQAEIPDMNIVKAVEAIGWAIHNSKFHIGGQNEEKYRYLEKGIPQGVLEKIVSLNMNDPHLDPDAKAELSRLMKEYFSLNEIRSFAHNLMRDQEAVFDRNPLGPHQTECVFAHNYKKVTINDGGYGDYTASYQIQPGILTIHGGVFKKWT